jgi:murein DD-endopeptidase MepM/ murein hydrolase activator NlpD
MKIKLLGITISLFFCVAGSPSFARTITPKDSIPKDSIEVLDENLDEDNANDSTAAGTQVVSFDVNAIPAANVYNCWNNNTVNPYHVDLAQKSDTTIFNLKGYVQPITGRINSDFGWRRWRWHYGTDIKLQTGDTLHSAFDGMIRIARRSRSFGNYIVIRHNNGLETVYGHLSKILVNINQLVKAGHVIGLGGSTGHSTGPHLHFEVRYLGNNINPNDIVDFQTSSLKCDTLRLCHQNFAYLGEIRQIRFHIVHSGDTLSKIAKRYGVTVVKLRQLNKVGKFLRKGQRIRYT